jgi:hypothetical protein
MATTPSNTSLTLNIPRVEAEENIKTRIAKGQDLLSLQIQTFE